MSSVDNTIALLDDDYQLFCRGKLSNPYVIYTRLREREPVHWSDGFNGWLLTRYADVHRAHLDPRLPSGGRLASYMDQLPADMQSQLQPLRSHYATWIGNLDPPDHTRLRTLVNKAFTPRVVSQLRPYIEQATNDLIDAGLAAGEMEFVSQFARRLPAQVIAHMLGVPTDQAAHFEAWSEQISNFLGTGRPQVTRAEQAQHAMFSMTGLIQSLVDERRRAPQNDLLTALVSVEEQGDRLFEQELIGMCVFLLVAGHETTMSLLSNGLLALLQHPDEMRRLREEPTLLPSAVEEILRYDSPLQHQVRTAREDLEIAGVHIKQGQRVVLMLGAANRDPEEFSDPDRLDIARQPNNHVAFGLGIHYCLGAPLARLEGQIAFEALLRKLTNMQLLNPLVAWREHTSMRCPKSLHLGL